MQLVERNLAEARKTGAAKRGGLKRVIQERRESKNSASSSISRIDH